MLLARAWEVRWRAAGGGGGSQLRRRLPRNSDSGEGGDSGDDSDTGDSGDDTGDRRERRRDRKKRRRRRRQRLGAAFEDDDDDAMGPVGFWEKAVVRLGLDDLDGLDACCAVGGSLFLLLAFGVMSWAIVTGRHTEPFWVGWFDDRGGEL